MSIENVSVAIITKNEEQNLKRLLPLLTDFPEVVIVDCGSVDKTKEVAESFSNVNFIHQDWLGFSAQKELAKNKCKNEWVFNLDADETFDTQLIDDIKVLVKDNKANGLICLCSEVLLGTQKPHKNTKFQDKLRFFRKSKAHYPTTSVHEKISLEGNTVFSKGKIYNWGTDIDDIIAKQNLYSSLAAKDRFEQGRKGSIIKLLFKAPIAFIKYYFLKRHFLDGMAGFISAVNYAHYSFQKEAKLLWLSKQRKS